MMSETIVKTIRRAAGTATITHVVAGEDDAWFDIAIDGTRCRTEYTLADAIAWSKSALAPRPATTGRMDMRSL
jgi:hypothetical protein